MPYFPSFVVNETLSSLQRRLSFLETSFRPPPRVDFLPEATADNPALAITARNTGIVSYRILLHHLSAEAAKLNLISAYIDLNTAIRIATLQASILSKLLALSSTINDLYAAQHRSSSLSSSHLFVHINAPRVGSSTSAFRQSSLTSRVSGEAAPVAQPTTEYDAHELRSMNRNNMRNLANEFFNACHSPPVLPPINPVSRNHLLSLNERFKFFSCSSAQNLRMPPPCRYGYPLFFSGELHDFMEGYDYLDKSALAEIADSHNVRIASSSSSNLTANHYRAALAQHQCNQECGNLIYSFVPMSHIRTMRSMATQERARASRTGTLPPVDTTDQNCYTKPCKQRVHAIINEWQEHFSTENQKGGTCACCARRIRSVLLEQVSATSINWSVLRNDALPDRVRPVSYNLQEYDGAILNPDGLGVKERKAGLASLCKDCLKSLKQDQMPKYALANWLYYAHDRLDDDVRLAFNDATCLEQALVARARCSRITFRYCHNPSSSQYGWNFQTSQSYSKGNVMVLPQDSLSLQRVLPPPPESVHDTMAVLFIGPQTEVTSENIKRLRPCLVRKSRTQTMINFLIHSNPYYAIDDDFQGFSMENLNALSGPNSLFLDETEAFLPGSIEVANIDSRTNRGELDVTADYTNRNDADLADFERSNDGDLLLENVGYTLGDTSTKNYNLMKIRALEHCKTGGSFIQSREGNDPIGDFENEKLLSWLFPHLDPWGIGGFHHPARKIPITLEEQLSYLISVDHSPFATDPSFAFVYYNIAQKKALVRDCMYRVKESQYANIINDLRETPVETLRVLERKLKDNPKYRSQDPEEKRLLMLLSRLQCINYKTPGTVAYKKAMRNEIWSLIHRYGPPALFVTLNPSDVTHPLVRLIAGEDLDLEDALRGEDMSKFDRRKLAADNPHATAEFFDRIIQGFINIVLRYGRDGPGLFGKCKAYYGAVEAQGKGTLHCHFLIWLDGHLPPQELRDKVRSDSDFKRELFEYLESIIKCEPPEVVEPVSERPHEPLQAPVRLRNEPNPSVLPLPRLATLSESEFERRYLDTVSKLVVENHWHRHNATCWKYLEAGEPHDDAHCRMRIDGSIEPETRYDEGTGNICIRRLHPRINQYNDVLTFLTQSNNDIKFIGTGEDAKALVYYVTDYITKTSLPTHVGLSALRAALDSNAKKFSNVEAETSTVNRSLFVKCANTMLGRSEISHPQVMSYLVGGGDVYKSHSFAPLMWTPFERAVRKNFHDTVPTHDEDDTVDSESQVGDDFQADEAGQNLEEELDAGVTIRIGNDGISKNPTLYDDYLLRPHEPLFENLCLYDFVRRTRKESAQHANRQRSREDTDAPIRVRNERGQFLPPHPQRDKYLLILRTKDIVPVLLGPTIPNKNKNDVMHELWARTVLILFKPWRHPSDLKPLNSSWSDSLAATQFSPFITDMIRNIGVMTECREARNLQASSRRHFQALNPSVGRDFEPGSMDDLFANLLLDEARDIISIDAVNEDGPITPRKKLSLSVRVFGDRIRVDPSFHGSNDSSRVMLDDIDKKQLDEHTKFIKDLKNSKRPLAAEEDDDDEMPLEGLEELAMLEPVTEVAEIDDANARGGDRSAERAPIHTINSASAATIQKFGLETNPEQLRAFSLITNHLASSDDQLLMYIGGVGGTGKSHVIKAIVHYLELLHSRDQIILAAPTGAAAVLIEGATIHSLTLPFSKKPPLEALTRLWQYVRLLILDEVSMIGASLMALISRRLNQARGLQSGEGYHFGKLNVVLMGDFGQLTPVRDSALFDHKLLGAVSSPAIVNSPDGQLKIQGASAWRQVANVVILRQNKRQASDPEYAALLDRVRVGGATKSDTRILRTRLYDRLEESDPNFMTAAGFADAPIIIGAKNDRDDLNHHFLHKAAERLDQRVGYYHSNDRLDRKALDPHLQPGAWRLNSTISQDRMGVLPLFQGMKVMLTENLAISHRLVNGMQGTVHSVLYDIRGDDIRYAKVCYVHFEGCGIRLPGFPPDVAPVIPTTTSFKYHERMTISRSQLPLLPSYSYTDYKSQGRSLPYAIVDLASAHSLQGAYVMLSRVTSLSGLVVLQDFPEDKVRRDLTDDIRKELARLERLDQERRCGTNDNRALHIQLLMMQWIGCLRKHP